MIDRKTFELISLILRDLFYCEEREPLKQSLGRKFGRVTVVFYWDNVQLLLITSLRKLLEDQYGNGRYIPLNMLDELPWVFSTGHS